MYGTILQPTEPPAGASWDSLAFEVVPGQARQTVCGGPEIMSVQFFQLSLDLAPHGSFTPHSARAGGGPVAGAQTRRDSDLLGSQATTLFPRLPRKEGLRPEICDAVRVRELGSCFDV